MSLFNQIFTTAIISYMCTTIGILYVLPSSTHKLFRSENTTLNRIMTETELSLMGSISFASTLLVTPFCGYLLDTLGRKGTLILFFLPQLFGWAILVTILRVEAFIFSMFLCGLSGSTLLIVPLYINEYCDPRIRGAMSSCGLVFQGLGVTISYLLGGLLDYSTMNYTGLIMTIIGLVFLCFTKESPLYLMKRGFEAEAAKSIAFYKGIKCSSIEVVNEMAHIRRILTADIHIDNTPQEQKLNPDEYKPRQNIPIWKYLGQSLSTRRILIILHVIFTSCLCQGLVVVEIYAKPLFEEAIPNISATLSSVMFGIISVSGGLLGAYLVDTVGRRILIIISSLATGLICVILGTDIQFSWGPNWLGVLLLFVYTITYSVGPKVVPVVLMGEAFLPEIKSFASMLCSEWAFMCSFIVLFAFNPLLNAFGLGPVFYLFAGFSFFTATFCYIFLPETKGLSVDVIQKKFLQM